MSSEFLRVAKSRSAYPEAAKTVWRLKKLVAPWDKEPDDLTDEEAYRLLLKKEWISLQKFLTQDTALQDISVLADFPGLTGLCLWDNEIVSIDALNGLTNIKRLGLRGNRIEDLAPIRRMRELKELEVQANPVRDFSVIAGLPALRDLEISSDQFLAFAPLNELNALRSLRIHDTCENLKLLPSLPNLRVLHLDGCKSLAGVERFKELRNLYVGSGELRDLAPIASLKKLTHLNFGHNQVETLEPLRKLFALRDLWAGKNRISNIEPLERLPVLHRVSLKENPVSQANVEALESSLSSWDDEFIDPHPRIQPALGIEIVDQATWDYYDQQPFNASNRDDNEGLFESEKSWLLNQIEDALQLDWVKDEDFAIPWQSPRARSHTVVLSSAEAAASLRPIAGAIQRVLCRARNEFIIYLQTDLVENAPNYIVWVYRNRILATPGNELTVTGLLSQ